LWEVGFFDQEKASEIGVQKMLKRGKGLWLADGSGWCAIRMGSLPSERLEIKELRSQYCVMVNRIVLARGRKISKKGWNEKKKSLKSQKKLVAT